MTISKDDLLAAASAGLIPHRQIEPLMVFLLQRDVYAQRAEMLRQRGAQAQHLVRTLFLSSGVFAYVLCNMFALAMANLSVYPGVVAVLLFGAIYMGSVARINMLLAQPAPLKTIYLVGAWLLLLMPMLFTVY